MCQQPSCPSTIHRRLLGVGTPDRCRFSSSVRVVTYALSGWTTCAIITPVQWFNPLRPALGRAPDSLPRLIQSLPLFPFQPSFPCPRLFCPRTGRCHRRGAWGGAIISSPDERGVLWRSRDTTVKIIHLGRTTRHSACLRICILCYIFYSKQRSSNYRRP